MIETQYGTILQQWEPLSCTTRLISHLGVCFQSKARAAFFCSVLFLQGNISKTDSLCDPNGNHHWEISGMEMHAAGGMSARCERVSCWRVYKTACQLSQRKKWNCSITLCLCNDVPRADRAANTMISHVKQRVSFSNMDEMDMDDVLWFVFTVTMGCCCCM